MSNIRNATEVLLSVEEKLDKLIKLLENKEFNNNIISNKLNKIISNLEQGSKNNIQPQSQKPGIFVEAADIKKPIVVDTIKVSNDNIQIDNSPIGHKRISRKENYANNIKQTEMGFKNSPIQIPNGKGSQLVDVNQIQEQENINQSHHIDPNNSIPVVQRILYSDKKAVFMAEVNVLSLPNLESISKTRTGGTGKWSAALKPGNYRAIIKHRNKITKETSEEHFDFKVDGNSNQLELDTVVLYKEV